MRAESAESDRIARVYASWEVRRGLNRSSRVLLDDANPGTDRRFEGFDTTIMSESTYRMTMPAPTIPIFNVFGICPLKISRTAREGRSHPPDRPERDFGHRIWRDTNMPGRRSHAAEGIVASVSETENRSEATAFRNGEDAL